MRQYFRATTPDNFFLNDPAAQDASHHHLLAFVAAERHLASAPDAKAHHLLVFYASVHHQSLTSSI